MKRLAAVLSIVPACLALTSALSYAQASVASSISGSVSDVTGGVVPGATVVVVDAATGVKYETVTNATGIFSLPALNPGTYTVSVSLTGFRTSVMENVRLFPGTPASIRAVLEVGSVQEAVVVKSSAELVNSETATVSATLDSDWIRSKQHVRSGRPAGPVDVPR